MSPSIRRDWLKGVLPEPAAERLLIAALAIGAEAPRAWQQWNEEVGLDRLDESSFRLLPLVFHNLTRQGFDFPQRNTLKGIYRRSWCKNQTLFHRIAVILRKLADAGMPTMTLKGAALSRLHYHDDGLRPMRDVDVLVPADRAQEAAELLDAEGWRRVTWAPRELTAAYRRSRHSMAFRRGETDEFDLHWGVLVRVRDADVERAFWANAVPFEIHGQKTLSLDATGQLLHACLHGMGSNAVSPIRWVADSMTILRGPEAIRWDFVLDAAVRNRVALFLGPALDYLARMFHASIPVEVLSRLAQEPVSRSDLAEFRRAVCSDARLGATDTVLATYRRHWRGTRDFSAPRRWAGFPAFLQCYWRLETPWHVGVMSAQWVWRRLAGDLRGGGF